MAKNYRAATGVDSFYYGVIDNGTTAETVERIKYLQEIEVEMEQDIERAYGDNKTAELAVSSGEITVTSQFHKLPIEDRQTLLGLEEDGGITSMGSTDNPPYVAVVFAKTYEDGSRQYVGLPKGMFTRPSIAGETKEDGVEFSSDEMEAQFMDREVDGFSDEKSVLFATDKKGETENRDALFKKLFGEGYAIEDEDEEEEEEEETP